MSFADCYDLEKGDPIRVNLECFGSQVGFRLCRAAFDNAFSNERRLVKPEDGYLNLRYPSQVTSALNMGTIVEVGRVAHLESVSARSFRATFDPAISLWNPPAGDLGAAAARLKPTVRSLLRGYNDTRPLGIEKYRLDIPTDYQQAYRFGRGDSIAIRLGEVDGVFAIGLSIAEDGEDSALTRRLQLLYDGDDSDNETSAEASPDETAESEGGPASRSNPGRSTSTQYGLHLPKQIIHTLGIDTDLSPEDDPHEKPLARLRLQPAVDHIVVTEA